MTDNHQAYEIEPTGENNSHCDCCGNQSRTIWGFVHEAGGGTVAAYYLQWTVGAPLDTHPANFDMIIGAWGEGATAADRCALSMVHFENENGAGVMVIDANERPLADSEMVSSVLTRKDVIGTPLASQAFGIFDAVIEQDPRLSQA